VGSEWSRQTYQLHTTPGFQAFSPGKVKFGVYVKFVYLGREASAARPAGKGVKNLKYEM